MTTLVRITIALALALFLSSCGFNLNLDNFGAGKKGSGVVVEETREITDKFAQVHASEGIEVYVTQGDEFKISVEADDNIIDLIATEVKNGKLKIHAIENIGNATKKVFVSLPEVTALLSSSGAQLTAQNKINATNLLLDASSGAHINAETNSARLEIDASSGAHIDVSGDANEAFIDGSSGANVKGKNLRSKDCHAEASSGANIDINVSESLTADASSGGNISYTGNASVSKTKSVSGSVNKY